MGTIRTILALSVLIAHTHSVYGFGLVGGQIAVQAFYIISGFYMTLILNEKYIGINNSYKLFMTNRLLRLFPIYWTVLFITILVSVALFYLTSQNSFGKLQPYYVYLNDMEIGSILFLILTNLLLYFQDMVMFLGIDMTTGNLFFTSDYQRSNPQLWRFLLVPQAWTVGIEITFYLIAPFIVRRTLSLIFIFILLSAGLRIVLYSYGLDHDPWTYRFFPTELVFFLLGTIAYHAYKKIDTANIRQNYLRIPFVYILAFTLLYSNISFEYKMYLYFFSFFICLPFIFILSKKWTMDRYIGELSYPIYISHMLIIMILDYVKIPFIDNLALNTLFFSILFSMLLNKLISERIERLRQGRLNSLTIADKI